MATSIGTPPEAREETQHLSTRNGEAAQTGYLAAPDEAAMTEIPGHGQEKGEVPIEFAGWLPAFRIFGNCGHHPQFSHTDVPPSGYRFVRTFSKPLRSFWLGAPLRFLATLLRRAGWLIWLAFRPIFAVVQNAWHHGPIQSLQTFIAALGLCCRLLRRGTRLVPTFQFVRSRQFQSQVLLPRRPNLLFLTSIPYTYGQHPWIIEIEDVTTLFFPFIVNGQTAKVRLSESPYLPIVKTLLESDSCRGIITHMRSTAEALPRIFGSEIIARKTSHIPCGTALPAVWQTHEPEEENLNLLFTCSWHQDPASFFLRGGLEVLRAFELLHQRYPHLRLTLRTGLPQLRPCYRRIVEKCWVRVIDRFLPDSEMNELMRRTHIFMLPAARIHIVSVLRAMAYGQVVVASDGWGFAEYVEHGRNGLIVPGCYGKMSWEDEETGMLREDYRPCRVAHPAVVRGLVESISALVEDRELRRRLGRQARQDVVTRYNLDNWNQGLKMALDKAFGAQR